MKIRNGSGKVLLRQLLHKHAPEQLFDRPKEGSPFLSANGSRARLSWAKDLLNPKQMKMNGFFNTDLVQNRWRSHLVGGERCNPSSLERAHVPGLVRRERPCPENDLSANGAMIGA